MIINAGPLSRPTFWRRLAAAIAVLAILPLAWIGPLDRMGEEYVEQGLKRAMLTFATARTVNGVISVVKSTTVSVPFVGGVSASPGQLLDPLDDLIEQFSALMLAACISLAAQRLLIAAGGIPVVSAGLTLLLLAWAWLHLLDRQCPRWIGITLALFLFVRFAVPIAALGSEAAFHAVMSAPYASAESGMTSASGSLSGAADEVKKSPFKISTVLEDLKAKVDMAVRHAITLMAIFVLQTIVLPLLFLWLAYRLLGATFTWRPALNLPRAVPA